VLSDFVNKLQRAVAKAPKIIGAFLAVLWTWDPMPFDPGMGKSPYPG
jgi:hypothetical protein